MILSIKIDHGERQKKITEEDKKKIQSQLEKQSQRKPKKQEKSSDTE